MIIGKTLQRLRAWMQRPATRDFLTAFAVYTLATVVMTYPVAFRLRDVLAGFSARDGWQYTWWLWFARRLLLEGRGLADLHLLNHPAGLQHPYQWTMSYLSLIALPLESLFSPAVTFNVMVMASFVLSGLSAYHLSRALTGSHWAAMVGGAIFAFAPNRLGHAMAGWLPQMTVYLYPWYALALTRTLRRPTWRRAVGLGVLTGIGASVYVMHIAYFLLPLTLIIVGAELIRLKEGFFKERRARSLGLAFAIAVIIALPPLLPLILGRFQEELSYLSTTGVVGHSTDLLALVTPSPYHPVLRAWGMVTWFARAIFPDQEALRAGSAYVGIVASLLALRGLARHKPGPWRWGVLAAVAMLLSLGPVLVVGGTPVQHVADGYETHIMMPYALVRQIPFLDWGRTPGRLNAVGMLGLGVLAAYGMADLLSRFDARRWRAGLVSLIAIAVILFGYLPTWPFPTGDAEIPPVIEHIAEQSEEGALLHLPMERRRVNHRALYFQTAVERPIVGGEVLRMLPETPPWWRSIEGLVRADSTPDVVPRPNEIQRQSWLRHFGVDWVLLHRLEPADEATYRPYLEHLLGPAVAEDKTLTAYDVPRDRTALESPYLYTIGKQGWLRPEQDGEVWRRWLAEEGQLYVYSTRDEIGSLRFNVDSHLSFPLLEVYGDEQLLDAFVVGARTTYTTRPITLTKGMNVFRFRAPAGCPEVLDDPRCWRDALLASPEDGPPPCDARTTCRTFIFDNVSFVPESDLSPGESASVDFGDRMRLRSWSIEASTLRSGDDLQVHLAWQTHVELSERYVVFVHLLSAEGELVAQDDRAPLARIRPPATWPPGATYGYPVTLEIPGNSPPGQYDLQVGIYLWPDMETLKVSSSRKNVFELGTVEVIP
jgi:hypothetical protein